MKKLLLIIIIAFSLNASAQVSYKGIAAKQYSFIYKDQGEECLAVLRLHDSVTLIGYDNLYWNVIVNDTTKGFMWVQDVIESTEAKQYRIALDNDFRKGNSQQASFPSMSKETIECRAILTIGQSWMTEWRRQQGLDSQRLVKKYGKIIGQRILDHNFWLGMTRDMATESLGKPNDINSTVGSWGRHEQWVYGRTYLYFENNLLTSYQN